jgi:hypothetical protein
LYTGQAVRTTVDSTVTHGLYIANIMTAQNESRQFSVDAGTGSMPELLRSARAVAGLTTGYSVFPQYDKSDCGRCESPVKFVCTTYVANHTERLWTSHASMSRLTSGGSW